MKIDKKVISWVVGIVVVLVLFMIVNPFVIVTAGEKGIVLNWGAVSEKVLSEGISWRVPIMQKVVKMDVKMQKEEVDASAASKDLQIVTSKVALNYHLDPENVNRLWKSIGKDYKSRAIDPSIQESVKAATAKYTAEELITKREQVKDDIKQSLKVKLASDFIIVDELNIINFDFSGEFNKTIESKQVAVQQALKAENDLRRIKTEAEQKIATAEAEAKSIKLQSDAADNERYVNLKKLEVLKEIAARWNGVLPAQILGQAPIPLLPIDMVK